MTMSIDSKIKEVSPSASQDGGANAPSGFILKLFQMVNGAPDEVISVSEEQFFFETKIYRMAALSFDSRLFRQ
jgi:hypothetical protein